MYSQSQGPCDDCRGKGEVIDEKHKCKTCNGKKVVKEKKIIEAEVDKGSPDGYNYVFHGEADEFPGTEPGDVVIIIKELPHKTFKRKGADLLIEKEITLLEALTGVDFVVTHLDGSKLRIKNTPGFVIKPDEIMTVIDKGLPFHKCSYKTGNLFVLFKVKFPASLTAPQVDSSGKALASMPKADTEMDCKETVKLEKYNEGQRNTHAQGGTEGDESEEDDEPQGGQRVQCAQQ